MKFITTRTHGVMDYTSGILLIISPWLFDFADGGSAQWIPVVIGLMVLGMSFFTRYELGVVKTIPMHIHLAMDVVAGLFLAASPWLFDFADRVFWPHLIFGLLAVSAGLFTYSIPTNETTTVR